MFPTSNLWFQLKYLQVVEQSKCRGTSLLLGAFCLLKNLGRGRLEGLLQLR